MTSVQQRGKVVDIYMSDSEPLYWTEAHMAAARERFPLIEFQSSPPGYPEFNGYAESAIGQAVSTARALMIDAPHLTNGCWQSALDYAIDSANRTATFRHDRTPYENWLGTVPDWSKDVPFGTPGYLLKGEEEMRLQPSRFQPVARLVYALRTSPNGQPGYLYYDPSTRAGGSNCRVKHAYGIRFDPRSIRGANPPCRGASRTGCVAA